MGAIIAVHETFILFNARSIANKWKSICSEIIIYNSFIIAITEHWLSDAMCQYFTFNNYQKIAKCRSGGRGGGVLMFFASHRKVVQIVLPVDAPLSCNVLCVKDVSTNLCWLLIYRPYHSIPVEETRQLHKAVEALLAAYHKIVILGDHNYRGIKWLNSDGPVALDAISYEFIELCASWNLSQLVSQPTREGRCLDFILTFNPEDFQAVTVQPPVFSSDHYLVMCTWTHRRLSKSSVRTHRTDYSTISNFFKSLKWSVLFAACHTVCRTKRKWCILIKSLKLSSFCFFTYSSTTFYSASDGMILF